MSTTLIPTTRPQPRQHHGWPRPGTCDRCGQPVIRARHQGPGRPAVLDPTPILPAGPCGTCHGTGTRRHEVYAGTLTTNRYGGRLSDGDAIGASYGATTLDRSACIPCNGTGRRGEPLGPNHLLLDATTGIARPYTGRRERWEAAHRRHTCEGT